MHEKFPIQTSHVIRQVAIRPKNHLNLLSPQEIQSLVQSSDKVYRLFRSCALAVLNTGTSTDGSSSLLKTYEDFDIQLIPQARGFKILLSNAPNKAFVDGRMIQGIQEHLFATVRDVLYCQRYMHHQLSEVQTSEDYTNIVFKVLRNANIIRSNTAPNLVVCWGGHAIARHEYDYSKRVGYQLGLRGLDVATGCGIGAMQGPMKGAALGHAKQQIKQGRFIGVTEPGIIAAESPNALVNELVILPDIEKRLEAFVRLAHVIIVFPGGAGTVEEILYILAILMDENNSHCHLSLIFASDASSKNYFQHLDTFLRACFGDEVAQFYTIITGHPDQVAILAKQSVMQIHKQRHMLQQSYEFNWQLTIPVKLQQPFEPQHESMAALSLTHDIAKAELCVNLRAAFSGIVAANVKPEGIAQIEAQGPYQLKADERLAKLLKQLLERFTKDGRMSSLKNGYIPSFSIQSNIEKS